MNRAGKECGIREAGTKKVHLQVALEVEVLRFARKRDVLCASAVHCGATRDCA